MTKYVWSDTRCKYFNDPEDFVYSRPAIIKQISDMTKYLILVGYNGNIGDIFHCECYRTKDTFCDNCLKLINNRSR